MRARTVSAECLTLSNKPPSFLARLVSFNRCPLFFFSIFSSSPLITNAAVIVKGAWFVFSRCWGCALPCLGNPFLTEQTFQTCVSWQPSGPGRAEVNRAFYFFPFFSPFSIFFSLLWHVVDHTDVVVRNSERSRLPDNNTSAEPWQRVKGTAFNTTSTWFTLEKLFCAHVQYASWKDR